LWGENDQLSEVGKKTKIVSGYLDEMVKSKSQVKSSFPRKIIISSNYKGFSIALGVGDVDVGIGYRRWESLLDGIPQNWGPNAGGGE
jgi:hypothetical protein